MGADTPHARFEHAANSPDPIAALHELARALRDEGMAQIDLYLLFSDYYELYQDDGNPVHERIAYGNPDMTDVMDLIWGGGWGRGGDRSDDLYDTVLTDEEINNRRQR